MGREWSRCKWHLIIAFHFLQWQQTIGTRAKSDLSIFVWARGDDHLQLINLTFFKWPPTNPKQTTGKYTVQHVAHLDDLSMSKLLQGDISHVFCCFPDVDAFLHSVLLHHIWVYGKHEMTTNHTHTAQENLTAERSPARIYFQVRSGRCAFSINRPYWYLKSRGWKSSCRNEQRKE